MKKYLNKVLNISALGLMFAALGTVSYDAAAQYDDDAYYDSDYSSDYSDDYSDYSDSTYSDDADYSSDYSGGSDSDISDYFDNQSSGNSGNGNYVVKPRVVVKPIERFVPPYDSTRELVSYSGVVDVIDDEDFEVEVDTIYHRAKDWMKNEFGEKELKKLTTMDDINLNASEMEYKIRLKGSFPCEIKMNDFRTVESGDVEFFMEIRIREGRYRYSVNRLVYLAEPLAGEKERDRTYFEYLMKSDQNVRDNDNILLAADRKINGWLDGLKETCRKQPVYEEDEW